MNFVDIKSFTLGTALTTGMSVTAVGAMQCLFLSIT